MELEKAAKQLERSRSASKRTREAAKVYDPSSRGRHGKIEIAGVKLAKEDAMHVEDILSRADVGGSSKALIE